MKIVTARGGSIISTYKRPLYARNFFAKENEAGILSFRITLSKTY